MKPEGRLSARAGVYISALELFSVGLGPSSSHTVGPMKAALAFRELLYEASLLTRVTAYRCQLLGSLAATGIGHGTPDAIIAGLSGLSPETADPEQVNGRWNSLQAGGSVLIDSVAVTAQNFMFDPDCRMFDHPNAMTLQAYSDRELLAEESFLSTGGGFIQRVGALPGAASDRSPVSTYRSTIELMDACQDQSIAAIAWRDEVAIHGAEKAGEGLDEIWRTMQECITAGLSTEGHLPGPLRVPRRAPGAWKALSSTPERRPTEELLPIYALAVNEENAAGGRVVTAPTNGAAGVIPAVLSYAAQRYRMDVESVRGFLLTAAAIGSIIKANASISGAEAGCQAEVGSACAMAAAGLAATLGGTPAQVENAAEIAIEHHLGLTCDPVGGMVQIPCIERNAVAAGTALTAARLALLGDGSHIVGLDTAIETMRQTGMDMSTRYKETSAGGLAINVVEC